MTKAPTPSITRVVTWLVMTTCTLDLCQNVGNTHGSVLIWLEMQKSHADVMAASSGHQALPDVSEQPRALAYVLVVLPELERDAV